jgi:hypothetical protein
MRCVSSRFFIALPILFEAIATDELDRKNRTYAGAAAALKKIRDIAEAM